MAAKKIVYRLKDIIERQGRNQREFIRRINAKCPHLPAIHESGATQYINRKYPDVERLPAILEELQISMGEILQEIEFTPDDTEKKIANELLELVPV